MTQRLGRLRSPFAPFFVIALALVASGIRWRLQASSNVYTALSKRFYVPDPDLGWRVSSQHPIWIGLDACAALFAAGVGVVAIGLLIRRRERAPQVHARVLRALTWVVAASSAVVPAAAFASGPGPLHARDTLPPNAAVIVEDGIRGALDSPAGVYNVVRHEGTAVTATLSAGGETFDARFDDVTGSWTGDPRDLSKEMHGDVSVAAASVDTGLRERTKHAREGYLHADQFPRISLIIDRVLAVRANRRDEVAFRAPATLFLMGNSHAVQVTGTLTRLDASAGGRLDVAGDALLVNADFRLPIQETALASKAHDFAAGEQIPVHVSLLLRRASD